MSPRHPQATENAGDDQDGKDRNMEIDDDDGENIGNNNGGSINNDFQQFCSKHDIW